MWELKRVKTTFTDDETVFSPTEMNNELYTQSMNHLIV